MPMLYFKIILITLFELLSFSFAEADQKQVDDMCFVSYSQGAGKCNSETGSDDAKFEACLKPVKVDLVMCCNDNLGSASCAVDAISQADQKQVDDMCFVSYSQGAGKCNSETGSDDAKFEACLKPVKADLVICCNDNLGSASCAADAK